MPKEKTICEVEFDKFGRKEKLKSIPMVGE